MPQGAPQRPPEVPGGKLVWERFVDKAVLKVQQRMFAPVSDEALPQFSRLLTGKLYQEVVEERAANRLCGLPTCGQPIQHDYTGQMRVSLARRQLYSLEALNQFCSESCLARSGEWERQLGEDSVYGRPGLGPVLRSLFPMLTDKDLRKLSNNQLLVSAEGPTVPLAPEVKVREAAALGGKPGPPAGVPERRLPSRRRAEPADGPGGPVAAGAAAAAHALSQPAPAALSAPSEPTASLETKRRESAPTPATAPPSANGPPPATPAHPIPERTAKPAPDLLGLTNDLADLTLRPGASEAPDSDDERVVMQTKCVGPFALLWDCLTDWVTADTRAYCRSGVVPPPAEPDIAEEYDELEDGVDSEDERPPTGVSEEQEGAVWSSAASQRRGALFQTLHPVFPAVAQGLQLGSMEPLHRLSDLLDTFRYPKPVPSLSWKARQLLAYVLLHTLQPHQPLLRGPLSQHGAAFVERLGFTPPEVAILLDVFTAADD